MQKRLIRQKIYLTTCVVMVLFALAACDNNGGGDTLPTLIPSDTPVSQPDDDATSTQEPPTARPARPTLPPTFTPTPTPTDVPTATPMSDTSGQVQTVGEPEACSGFGLNTLSTDEEIQIGSTATVSWRGVVGAGAYWVLVFDGSSNPEDPIVVHERYTEDVSYVIPEDVFRAPVRYGWEVRPLDAVGVQMCQGRGGLINVRP